MAVQTAAHGLDTDRLRAQYRRKHVMGRVTVYVLAIFAALCCAGPYLWSAITAFKLNSDLYNAENNPFLFNDPPTLDHIKFLFTETPFLTFVWNTLWMGFLVTVITLGTRTSPAMGTRSSRKLKGSLG